MNRDCLNEQDLILLHYGELPEGVAPAEATAHLAACASCRTRREQLAADLARIPALADPDPMVATRIAARVNERLRQKRRWLPMAGAVTAGAVTLAMAVLIWSPDNRQADIANQPLLTSSQQPANSTEQLFIGPPRPELRQATLDLDLLEQLDLLEELETLRDIEGV